MSANSSETWEQITRAYSIGNWYEAIRLARMLTDSDPHSIAVRQLLAALYTQSSNARMAQIQYERLLPLAVGQGDLLGALAAQKHLDQSNADAPRHAGRFAAMHKWFRSLGRSGFGSRDEQVGGPTQADLLRLPVEVFSQISEATEIETLGMSPRTLSVRGGAVRVVLYGRVTWTIEMGDGTRIAPRTAERGQSVIVDPRWGDEVWLVMIPEAPSECLCFDTEIVTEMTRAMPELSAVLRDPLCPKTAASVVAAVPVAAPAPVLAAAVPVAVSASASGRDEAPATNGPPLPRPSLGGMENASDPSVVDSFGTVDLSSPTSPPSRRGNDDLAPFDPGERSLALSSTENVDRRRDPRVEVGLLSRVALIGLAGDGLEPLRGRLVDLSISGMSIRFPTEQRTPAYQSLANSLVSIDLEFPEPAPSLTLAGRVRHLREEPNEASVLLGVEFVLSTEIDRARLLDAVNQAESKGPQAA